MSSAFHVVIVVVRGVQPGGFWGNVPRNFIRQYFFYILIRLFHTVCILESEPRSTILGRVMPPEENFDLVAPLIVVMDRLSTS